MIIFKGTNKKASVTYLNFTNEAGSEIGVPVDEKTALLFLHHFDRLSPGAKEVEVASKEDVKTS